MVSFLLQAPNEASSTYFANEIRILRILGVSLYDNEGIPYRIYSFLVILVAVILYSMLDGYELTTHGLDDGLADIMIFEGCAILLAVKIILILRNRRHILNYLTKLEQEPFLPNAQRGGAIEIQLSKECAWIIKTQRVTLLGFTYVVCAVILVVISIQRIRSSDFNDWNYPFGALTIMNVTYSPNYELSQLYQSFCVMFMAPVYMTTDILLAGVLVHISYQFKILQNYIRQLVDLAGVEMKKNGRSSPIVEDVDNLPDPSVVSWKYLKKFLRKAVRYHQDILDLNQDVENIFNVLLLAQLLFISSQLCLVIYITAIETNNVQRAKNIGLFLIQSSQPFLVSYWAEEVLHECQQVGQAAYESNFIGTDIRFQQSLIFIMQRSEMPWQITAGKFSVMSLATFAWIIQSSYSTFTVLQTFNSN